MANQVVKVKRETIVACMTCPLCNKLFRDATTISECLHTFCRKCIYDKITDEELECCPICNIDLGCVPLEKLRPDHSLQDVRAKIFPLKGRKVSAHEVIPSVPLPARRKERSLSSLVVSTPRVSTQSTMTGRRTKPTRKPSGQRTTSFSIEKPVKKEEESLEDRPDSSSSPDTSNKVSQNNGRSLSPCEGSQPIPDQGAENGAESWDAKLDLWKPLNCLVEVASRSKSFKSNVQGSDAKLDPVQVNDSDSQVQRLKNKENKRKAKVEDEKVRTDPVSSDTAKPNKLRRVRRKKERTFGESAISPQAVLDATSPKLFRTGPIWFCLVASENQEGDAPLPQIPASYVRIKDGSIPVSFIQKYLMKKLDLTSEAEVEIKCMGQPVIPTLRLHNLVELWLDMASTSQRIPATIGSSAKDFVMVLAYARKGNKSKHRVKNFLSPFHSPIHSQEASTPPNETTDPVHEREEKNNPSDENVNAPTVVEEKQMEQPHYDPFVELERILSESCQHSPTNDKVKAPTEEKQMEQPDYDPFVELERILSESYHHLLKNLILIH